MKFCLILVPVSSYFSWPFLVFTVSLVIWSLVYYKCPQGLWENKQKWPSRIMSPWILTEEKQKFKTDIEMILCVCVMMLDLPSSSLFSQLSVSANSHNYCYTIDQERKSSRLRVRYFWMCLGYWVLDFSSICTWWMICGTVNALPFFLTQHKSF